MEREARNLRRSLRSAVYQRDSAKLCHLVANGLDVNMALSDVFLDTPLMCVVRYGYLEIVELLLDLPGCAIDLPDRNQHTALDEALCGVFAPALSSPDASSHHMPGRRYRILRCLLKSGAKNLSEKLLNSHVFTALHNPPNGLHIVGRVVEAFCKKGHPKVQNSLLSCLLPYSCMTPQLRLLLSSGADPSMCIHLGSTHQSISLTNVLLLVSAINDDAVLRQLEQTAACILKQTAEGDSWLAFCKILRLLCLCGHQPHLFVMNYLYNNHASMYLWIHAYHTGPPPLTHLARVAIRKSLKPNVYHAVQNNKVLPHQFKLFLVFQD